MRDTGARSGCPIGCALDLVGDRWTLLLMRDLLLGGQRRFGDLGRHEGIATNVLAERLRRLEAAGLVRKSRDPDDGRRTVYTPTERGADLIPAILELGLWGALHTDQGSDHRALFEAYRSDRAAVVARLRARALAHEALDA